jgi:acyl carrier protein
MATDIRDTIIATIGQVLSDRGRDPGQMDDVRGLFADGIGLDSLDFATVVVRLEQQTGLDPFRTGQVSRPPATLGQLVAVYRDQAAAPVRPAGPQGPG